MRADVSGAQKKKRKENSKWSSGKKPSLMQLLQTRTVTFENRELLASYSSTDSYEVTAVLWNQMLKIPITDFHLQFWLILPMACHLYLCAFELFLHILDDMGRYIDL